MFNNDKLLSSMILIQEYNVMHTISLTLYTLFCSQSDRERVSSDEQVVSLQRLAEQLESQLKERDVFLAQARDDTNQEKANTAHIRYKTCSKGEVGGGVNIRECGCTFVTVD